jgi:curved DNA-binding protein CbpA
MDVSKDYYAVLGVLPSVEPAAIRAVYLALLKKYHPDVYVGTEEEAVRKTIELNVAYDALGDQKKREEYDRLRTKSEDQAGYYERGSSYEVDGSSGAQKSNNSDQMGNSDRRDPTGLCGWLIRIVSIERSLPIIVYSLLVFIASFSLFSFYLLSPTRHSSVHSDSSSRLAQQHDGARAVTDPPAALNPAPPPAPTPAPSSEPDGVILLGSPYRSNPAPAAPAAFPRNGIRQTSGDGPLYRSGCDDCPL